MLTDAHRAAHAEAVTGWLFPYEEFGGELMDRTGDRWGASRQRMEATFAKLPDPVLAALSATVTLHTLPGEALTHLSVLAYRWLSDSFRGGDTELSADKLGRWLQFADVFTAACVPGGLTPAELASDELVPTLNNYEDMYHSGEESVPRNGYFDMGEAEVAAVRAFVLARILYSAVGRTPAPAPKATLVLFQRHHREPQRIAELVRERGTLDAGILGPILDSGAPAIAEGAL